MSRHLCGIFIASLVIGGMLVFFAVPGALADDTFTSSNWEYPDSFDNNWLGTNSNDLQELDAVYFGGRELVIFSLFSSDDLKYDKYLYFYTPQPEYRLAFDVGNSTNIYFMFKTCVYNNVLYLFYTPHFSNSGYSTSTIYYRTVTVNYGTVENPTWSLNVSSLKSFSAGHSSAKIRTATTMNGIIYVIFTAGSNWYYISSVDGLHFSSSSLLLSSSDGIRGAGGAVFQVPDQEDGEKLMLAYCTTGDKLKYFFFNGLSAYGLKTVNTTVNNEEQEPLSVRLIAGSATNYTSEKYSIQVWLALPHDQEWSSMYHREYIPSGPEGDSGYWSPTWNRISTTADDRIYFTGNAYDPDHSWMVIPFFESIDQNTQMSLRIWYYKGIHHTAGIKDHTKLRRSTYKSDFLVYNGSLSNTVDASTQDLTTSTVLGIIEGGPPFPKNSGPPYAPTSNTSSVELSATSTIETSTAWTVGGTITLSMGKTFRKATVESKLAAGLSYTKGTTSADTTSITYTCASFANEVPGDTGWAVVLKPEIINSAYILYSYKGLTGGPLRYHGYTGDQEDGDVLRLSVITFGEGTFLDVYPYLLQTPSEEMSYASAFKGMGARPLGTDVVAWQDALMLTDPSYTVKYKLVTIGGAPTTNANLKVIDTTTEAETYTPSANFSAKASALGFGVEANVNFKMDISTKTIMTSSLGFWYKVPLCDSTTTCCVDKVDVTPYILTPNEDDTGYDAPWISDDIRNYGKPKPWCISYRIQASPCRDCSITTSEPPVELSVVDAKGSFHRNRAMPNNDRISAKLILEGIASDFTLEELKSEQVLHLRVGNFIVNSNAQHLLSRYIQGNSLVLELSESEDSGDYYIVKLTLDKKRSQLNIDLEGDEVDISQLLHAYGLANVDQPSKGEALTVPFHFFLGNKFSAEGNLRAHCVVNKWNDVCKLRSAK